jgi:hypothetical protein
MTGETYETDLKFDEIDDTLIRIIIDSGCFNVYKKLLDLDKINVLPEHLDWACGARIHNVALITYIMDHKIIPTHKHFELLNQCINEKLCEKYYQNQKINKKINEITEILIKFGIEITLDDIKQLAKEKIELSCIGNVEVDDELFQICYDGNFSPKYLEKKELSAVQLHKLFLKYTKLSEIKKIIGKKKIKYDITCLRNACKFKLNKGIINFLISKGVKPDLTCLENIINARHDLIIGLVYNAIKDKLKIEI